MTTGQRAWTNSCAVLLPPQKTPPVWQNPAKATASFPAHQAVAGQWGSSSTSFSCIPSDPSLSDPLPWCPIPALGRASWGSSVNFVYSGSLNVSFSHVEHSSPQPWLFESLNQFTHCESAACGGEGLKGTTNTAPSPRSCSSQPGEVAISMTFIAIQ